MIQLKYNYILSTFKYNLNKSKVMILYKILTAVSHIWNH
jgi:hypothetical protein